jgi:hypothetical protein
VCSIGPSQIFQLDVDDCYAEYYALSSAFHHVSMKKNNQNCKPFDWDFLLESGIQDLVLDMLKRHKLDPEASLTSFQLSGPYM